MNNIRWAKRVAFTEDENDVQRENEIEIANQEGIMIYGRLQIRVTETDWEDIPVVWE